MKVIVGLSCWVLGALQGAILILVPVMMDQGEMTAWMIAIPLALGTFIFVIGSGYWGRWLDRCVVNQRPLSLVLALILFGFMLSQLSFLSLLESNQLTGTNLIVGLCFSRVLHGMFCSGVIPTAQLWLAQKDKQGEKLIWVTISTNMGRVTAPLLTFVPLNVTYFSLWFVLFITFLACISCFFLMYYQRDNKQLNFLSSPKYRLADGYVGATTATVSTAGSTAVITDTLARFGSTIMMTAFFITLFSSQLQFSLGPILSANGVLTAFQASAMTAQLLLSASISALFSLFVLYKLLIRSTPLFLSFITLSFALGTVLLVLDIQLMLSVILISSALAMAPVWYTATAMGSTETRKARVSASISQAHTLGNAFGALLAGLLLTWNSDYLFLGFAILMVLIVLGWLRLYRQSAPLNNAVVNLPRQSVIEK
ncbi:permease [Moritella marina ATCC 15381]|uniref:Permease n=1 Tax=Moritella marina ATCC 15381 TaxID=1202962 RepID=A0A5J6WPS9_MORMI|nr:MFS transporter [Moritella marina]QFI38925.1 permease [Moritella marina ATCC 15381]